MKNLERHSGWPYVKASGQQVARLLREIGLESGSCQFEHGHLAMWLNGGVVIRVEEGGEFHVGLTPDSRCAEPNDGLGP